MMKLVCARELDHVSLRERLETDTAVVGTVARSRFGQRIATPVALVRERHVLACDYRANTPEQRQRDCYGIRYGRVLEIEEDEEQDERELEQQKSTGVGGLVRDHAAVSCRAGCRVTWCF